MERFRTVRISDPRFESDHLRYLTIKSEYLMGRGDICVFIPPEINEDTLPITILLHGVYGSSWSWSQAAGAHHTALKLIRSGKIRPMILAMPSDGLWGDGSAYLPHNNYNFERWITEDVIDAVRLNISQANNSETSFLAGLSMGGFGALRMGAKYPGKFTAFSGLSSITHIEQMKMFVEESISNFMQSDEKDENVFSTIHSNKKTLSPFRFDCGTEDVLIDQNRHLHQLLKEAEINHIYEENPGQHDWVYWEKHVEDTLIFFDKFI